MQRKKLPNTTFMCSVRPNKQSVELIYCQAPCTFFHIVFFLTTNSLKIKILSPSELFSPLAVSKWVIVLLSGYNQPVLFPVRQPFPLLDHFHVTSLPSTYLYTSAASMAAGMAASLLLILWHGYCPIFKYDSVVWLSWVCLIIFFYVSRSIILWHLKGTHVIFLVKFGAVHLLLSAPSCVKRQYAISCQFIRNTRLRLRQSNPTVLQ